MDNAESRTPVVETENVCKRSTITCNRGVHYHFAFSVKM